MSRPQNALDPLSLRIGDNFMALFRALRGEEISAGHVLIPKSQAPFRAHPRLPNVLPFNLGERGEHAVKDHQWDGKFPTRGDLTPKVGHFKTRVQRRTLFDDGKWVPAAKSHQTFVLFV